jgi:hypothetical protein
MPFLLDTELEPSVWAESKIPGSSRDGGGAVIRWDRLLVANIVDKLLLTTLSVNFFWAIIAIKD